MKKILYIMIMLIVAHSAFADQAIESIEPAFFYAKLESFIDAEVPHALLDIRTYPEYIQGHIDTSVQIDFYSTDFVTRIKKLPKDIPYLIYCRSGNRTNQTLNLMKQLGFKEVYDLKGGIRSWLNSGYKLIK